MGFLGRFVRRTILLGFGMIWQSIVNCFIATSQGFEHILINRTLAGVGSSPQHPTGAAYIAETFPKRQLGRVMGTNIAVAQIGSFVTPLVGSLLLLSLGWRATIVLLSIPGMVVGAAFLFIVEPKRSQKWFGLSTFTILTKGVREVLR